MAEQIRFKESRPIDFVKKLNQLIIHYHANYESPLRDIKSLAQGEDPNDVKKHYEGWTQEDFQDLLNQYEKSVESLPGNFKEKVSLLKDDSNTSGLRDIEYLAQGEDPNEVKENYAGWTQGNFKTLLEHVEILKEGDKLKQGSVR